MVALQIFLRAIFDGASFVLSDTMEPTGTISFDWGRKA